MKMYIFGYGSLINSESRKRTGHTGKAIPCRVNGLKRSWTQPIKQDKVLALEVVENVYFNCNGVLIKVKEKELPKFDNREVGYKRIKLEWDKVEPHQDDFKKKGTVWVYVNDTPRKVDKDYKIIQSYIDVILVGCLEYGKDFAKEFIETTYGWDYPYINDRAAPIYPRALRDFPQKSDVDLLLRSYTRL